MKRSIYSAISLLFVALATPVFGADNSAEVPGPPPSDFGATPPPGPSSSEGEGAMGRKAIDPSASSMFQALDSDKDGTINRDEAKRSAETSANFEAIDSNHDGRLSLPEWKAAEDRKMGR